MDVYQDMVRCPSCDAGLVTVELSGEPLVLDGEPIRYCDSCSSLSLMERGTNGFVELWDELSVA